MKTTRIANLTIHRIKTPEEWDALVDMGEPGVKATVWESDRDTLSDEEILAQVECTKLVDDEVTADHARDVRRIIIMPKGLLGTLGSCPVLFRPPKQCVINRERSIRARQSAIRAGLVPEYTPLV